jgi:hypothetical protein
MSKIIENKINKSLESLIGITDMRIEQGVIGTGVLVTCYDCFMTCYKFFNLSDRETKDLQNLQTLIQDATKAITNLNGDDRGSGSYLMALVAYAKLLSVSVKFIDMKAMKIAGKAGDIVSILNNAVTLVNTAIREKNFI